MDTKSDAVAKVPITYVLLGGSRRRSLTTGRSDLRIKRANCCASDGFLHWSLTKTWPRRPFVGTTPDHYLPLVYVLAQHREGDAVSFPVEGFDGGSISM